MTVVFGAGQIDPSRIQVGALSLVICHLCHVSLLCPSSKAARGSPEDHSFDVLKQIKIKWPTYMQEGQLVWRTKDARLETRLRESYEVIMQGVVK